MGQQIKNMRKKLLYIFGGTVLTADFFVKNTRFILLIFIILVFYISNRYSCNEKIAEIGKLESELKDAKYESQTIAAKLVGVSRESTVLKMLEEKEIVLERPTEPIYKIQK